MAEVSGFRSRNHFEPNCKSRAVDEGKPLFISSNRCVRVSRLRSQRGELNLDVFHSFCRLCLCEWQTLAFPLARRFCFQLGDPRCPAKCGTPARICLLQLANIASTRSKLCEIELEGYTCSSAFVFSLLKTCFPSESCCLKLILTRIRTRPGHHLSAAQLSGPSLSPGPQRAGGSVRGVRSVNPPGGAQSPRVGFGCTGVWTLKQSALHQFPATRFRRNYSEHTR